MECVLNGQFNTKELAWSTNTKEILAVYFGLRSFEQYFHGKLVLVMSDSTTAISVVCKMGSMESLLHDQLAQDIWNFARNSGIWLHITYIPGKANTDSDIRSRQFNKNTEWELPLEIFQMLQTHFRDHGPFVIDLFALRLNYKIIPYYSFIPDLFTAHVDAFLISWSNKYSLYAYPPFSVLTRTLQKIRTDKVTVMLVFPLWPTQPWFNHLLQLLITGIVLLPRKPLIFLPWKPKEYHQLLNHVRLCSTILSPEPAKRQKFLQQLPNSYNKTFPHLNNREVELGLQNGVLL